MQKFAVTTRELVDARRRLQRRLELLSDFECAQLLRLFDDVSAGERYWGDDIREALQRARKAALTAAEQRRRAADPLSS
jgi:hypothetical protein